MPLNARFDVLTAVLQKIQLFGDFMLPSWVNTFLRLERMYCLPLQVQTVKDELQLSLRAFDPEDRTFNDPSKRRELFTQRHNITPHKTPTFIALSSAGYYLNNHTSEVSGLL
jgi:hypothetical protein